MWPHYREHTNSVHRLIGGSIAYNNMLTLYHVGLHELSAIQHLESHSSIGVGRCSDLGGRYFFKQQ